MCASSQAAFTTDIGNTKNSGARFPVSAGESSVCFRVVAVSTVQRRQHNELGVEVLDREAAVEIGGARAQSPCRFAEGNWASEAVRKAIDEMVAVVAAGSSVVVVSGSG
jgi:hypothetical protein